MAAIFIGIAGAAAGGWGDVASALIQVGLVSSIFGYSQDLEREADIKAYELLLQADYDVREMPALYRVLGEDYEGLQPRIKGSSTTTRKRLSSLRSASSRRMTATHGVMLLLVQPTWRWVFSPNLTRVRP